MLPHLSNLQRDLPVDTVADGQILAEGEFGIRAKPAQRRGPALRVVCGAGPDRIGRPQRRLQRHHASHIGMQTSSPRGSG